MTGLEIQEEVLNELLHVENQDWMAEADDVEKFFDSLGPRVPWELRNELEALRNRLSEPESNNAKK
jgi:phosphoenolpyruvate carboxykinase (GTP)